MTETSGDTTSPRSVTARGAVTALPLLFVRGVTRILEVIPKLIEKLAFLE